MQSAFENLFSQDTARAEDGEEAGSNSKCPQGHELQAWSARAGVCDKCGKPVQEGETVMDCRWCDWYLCKACLPVYQAQTSSLWGAIAALPVYAIDAVEGNVNNVLASVGMASEQPRMPKASQGKGAVGTPQEKAATMLITDFCENYSTVPGAAREPTHAELESLWVKCSMLPPAPVAEALCEQLSWVADFMWPPKLRALCAVEHFHGQGSEGEAVARLVLERAGKLVQQLTGVPQCKSKAIELVRKMREREQQQQQEQQEREQQQQVRREREEREEAARVASACKVASGDAHSAGAMGQPEVPAVDLLDLVTPAAQPAAKASQLDLLDGIAFAPTPAAVASAAAPVAAPSAWAAPGAGSASAAAEAELPWTADFGAPAAAAAQPRGPLPAAAASAAGPAAGVPVELTDVTPAAKLESLVSINVHRLGA